MIFVRGFDVLTILVYCPFTFSDNYRSLPFTKVFIVNIGIVLLPEIKGNKSVVRFLVVDNYRIIKFQLFFR